MLIKLSKKDILWSYAGVIFTMGSNLLLLPFMLRFVDADQLGLWYVYLSIGGFVTLFDFGFNPTFARNITYCWSGAQELTKEGVIYANNNEPNFYLLKKVIKTCRAIYLTIALVALFVLLLPGTAFIYKVAHGIFNIEILISWIAYVSAVVLNIYFGYYVTLLRGVGAISQCNKINIISRILQIITSITLMWLGCGIIAVSVAYLLYGFLLRFFSRSVFFNYKNIGQKLESITKSIVLADIKELFFIVWHNAWRDGLIFISNYCAGQVGTLIASNYLTLKETGIYSISVQFILAISAISGTFYGANQPAMQSAYINDNKVECRRLMGTAMVVYSFMFTVMVAALLIIGIPVLQLLKDNFRYDRVVIVGIAIYYYIYRRQGYYASFISNTNKIPYMPAYIFSSLLGVILALILTGHYQWGVWGLIVGQALPQLLYNCWKWPNMVYDMLETNSYEMLQIGAYEFKKAIKKEIFLRLVK